MCRLYGFRATAPTKVECTLVHAQNALLLQSRADSRGKSHPDGWGIGFYHDAVPEVERRASPAYEDLYFSTTAERVYSQTVVAHVRMATVGRPRIANTHPFSYGRWVFAHNGTLSRFARLRGRLEREVDAEFAAHRAGATDSELIFVWMLTRMARAGISPDLPCSDVAELEELVAEAVRHLAAESASSGARQPSKLNFLLTDGKTLIASRWNHTLYWVARHGIRDCEICGIPHVHEEPGHDYRAVVVASEPISHEPWQELPEHSILSVDADVRAEVRSIDSAVVR